MDKYSWSYEEDMDIWHESGKTIEDCIAQAEDTNKLPWHGKPFVYVGENVKWEVSVEPTGVLEALEQCAYEQCGEAAENWESFGPEMQAELDELGEQLSTVVIAWLKKSNREPVFYTIENIKQYPLANAKCLLAGYEDEAEQREKGCDVCSSCAFCDNIYCPYAENDAYNALNCDAFSPRSNYCPFCGRKLV